MRRARVAMAVIAIIGAVVAGAAASTDGGFERGNSAYLHGDYPAAIAAYEEVIASIVIHEDLHYNLANAYFKADRLGPAIFHYERSLSLDPGRDDAEANLALARKLAATRWQDKLLGVEADPWWIRFLTRYTLGGATIAFFALYAALFILLVAAYLLDSGFVRASILVMLFFVFWGTLGAGGLLAGRWWLANEVELAVALPDETTVREGPDDTAQTAFLVHAGLRLRITDQEQDWVRIRLANGLEGWMRRRDVGKL